MDKETAKKILRSVIAQLKLTEAERNELILALDVLAKD